MSRLHLRQSQPDRQHRLIHVTPESAGWDYVGFDLYRLRAGESASASTETREHCLVFVAGRGKAEAAGSNVGALGERQDPFSGKPWSLYVPAGSGWQVVAETDLELAVCSAPGVAGSRPPRVIGPDSHGIITRGKGANVRYVTDIINENDPADGLLVVEVITPAGNASSYPPHKHDTDNLPAESSLEETYYHRLDPPQGFAFQRVYTGDRTIDQALAVEDHDVVLVPRGYHPVAVPYGYTSYYLNVMAGPKREWHFKNDPAHEWLLKGR